MPELPATETNPDPFWAYIPWNANVSKAKAVVNSEAANNEVKVSFWRFGLVINPLGRRRYQHHERHPTIKPLTTRKQIFQIVFEVGWAVRNEFLEARSRPSLLDGREGSIDLWHPPKLRIDPEAESQLVVGTHVVCGGKRFPTLLREESLRCKGVDDLRHGPEAESVGLAFSYGVQALREAVLGQISSAEEERGERTAT